MKEANDSNKYQIKISNIALFVPVAQLSSSVFNELSTILSRKNEPHAISIHYRRIEIRPVSIMKDKIEFYSESLFSDSDLPCRIVICFIQTEHKNGTQTSNPFAFNRSWEVDVTENNDSVTIVNETVIEKKIENKIDQRFEAFERKFLPFLSAFAEKHTTSSKGKGRGKGKKKCDDANVESTSDPGLSRLNEFIDASAEPCASSVSRSSTRSKSRRDLDIESDLFTEDGQPFSSVRATKKTIYIQKVDCQLNSTSLDQVEDKSNIDECMQMFWRMYKYNGQVQIRNVFNLTYELIVITILLTV